MTEILSVVRAYDGTPFRHQGRLPGRGLDCAGILVCALGAKGASVTDSPTYRRVPRPRLLLDALAANGYERVPAGRDNDVIVFTYRGHWPMHIGVIDGSGFWHVEEGGAVHWEPPFPGMEGARPLDLQEGWIVAAIGLVGIALGAGLYAGGGTLGTAATIGLTVASIVGSAIDNAFVFPWLFGKDAPRPAEIGSVSVTYAEEGEPVNYIFGGRTRVPGRVTHMSQPRRVETTAGTGKQAEQINVTWYADVTYAACWNQSARVDRIDFDGQPVYFSPTERNFTGHWFGPGPATGDLNIGFEETTGTGEWGTVESVQVWEEAPGWGDTATGFTVPWGAWYLQTWYMTIEGKDGFDTGALAQFIIGHKINVTHTVNTGEDPSGPFTSFYCTENTPIQTPSGPGTADCAPIVVESRVIGVDPATGFSKGRLVLDMRPWIDRGNGGGQFAYSQSRTQGTPGTINRQLWAGPIPYEVRGVPGNMPEVALGWKNPNNPTQTGGYPFSWPSFRTTTRPYASFFVFEQSPEGWNDDILDEDESQIFLGSGSGQKSNYLTALVGSSRTPGMPQQTYVAAKRLNLSKWGNRVPQPTFHLAGHTSIRGTTAPYSVAEAMHRISEGLAGIPETDLSVGFDPASGAATRTPMAREMRGISTTALTEAGKPITSMLTAYDMHMGVMNGRVRVWEASERPTWTVDALDLDAREFDARPTSAYRFTHADGTSQPQTVNVTFKSTQKSLQQGNEKDTYDGILDFASGIDRTVRQISFGEIAMEPVEAKQSARRINRDAWLRQREVNFRLPWKYSYIFPGGTIYVPATTQGTTFFDRDWWILLNSVDVAKDHVLHCTGTITFEDPTATIPEEPDFAPPAARLPEPQFSRASSAEIRVLDVGPLFDRHAGRPGIYLAISETGYESGGGGGLGIYESLTDGPEFQRIEAATGYTTMGTLREPLPPSQTAIIDYTHSILVRVFGSGEFESTTTDQLDRGDNRIAIQSGEFTEILQFLTATQVTDLGDQYWRLTGLLRGRVGTGSDIPQHGVGSTVIAIRDGLQFIEFDNSVRNTTRRYVAATPKQINKGRTGNITSREIFANSNRALPPTHFSYYRSSGDVVMSWVRQSRTSFRLLSQDGAPLPEGTESYDIVIDPGGTDRTVTGLTTPTHTYSSADQTTDGLLGEEFTVHVFQNDPASGRGQVLVAIVRQEYGNYLDENGTDRLVAEDDRPYGTES